MWNMKTFGPTTLFPISLFRGLLYPAVCVCAHTWLVSLIASPAAFHPWSSFLSLPPWGSVSGWLPAIHPSGPSSRVTASPTVSPLLALIPHVCLIFCVLLSEGCGSRDLSFLLSVTLAEPSTVLGIHSFAKWMNRWPVHPRPATL